MRNHLIRTSTGERISLLAITSISFIEDVGDKRWEVIARCDNEDFLIFNGKTREECASFVDALFDEVVK